MTDTSVMIVLLLLAALCSGIFFIALIREKHNRMRGSILLHQTMLLGWLLSSILYLLVTDFQLAAYVYDLRIPFVSFAALALLLFIFRYHSMEAYLSKTVVCLLCLIPLMTLLVTLVPEWRPLLRYDVQVLSTVPYHEIIGTRGIWFWLHTAYSYFLMAATFITAVRQSQKTPVIYRRASGMVVIGLVAVFAGNLLTLLTPTYVKIDMTLVFACLCSALLYFVSRQTHGMGLLYQGRNNVFHELSEAVVVLDEDEHVIYQNRAWENLLAEFEADIDTTDYRTIKEALFRTAEMTPLGEQIYDGEDYSFAAPRHVIYNLQEKEISGEDGRKVGAVIICEDVTKSREKLREINKTCGMDPLTGLLTRARIEIAIRDLERRREMPLIVISGDLNQLKYVNDSFGHAQGDVYLRTAGEALLSHCPPSAYAARMGGDEFLILIPRFSMDAAIKLIDEIKEHMKTASALLPYQASIALGASAREAPDEPLEDTIKRADEAMYRQKQTFPKQH